MCFSRTPKYEYGVTKRQGWTKFTTFGDLDAMDESEWDKVCLSPPLFLHILRAVVLVRQCQSTSRPPQSRKADL
jgi:hypothetical protein